MQLTRNRFFLAARGLQLDNGVTPPCNDDDDDNDKNSGPLCKAGVNKVYIRNVHGLSAHQTEGHWNNTTLLCRE